MGAPQPSTSACPPLEGTHVPPQQPLPAAGGADAGRAADTKYYVPSDILKFTAHLAEEIDPEELAECRPLKWITVGPSRCNVPLDPLHDGVDDRVRRVNPDFAAEYDRHVAELGGDAPPLHQLAEHMPGRLELVFD